MWDMWFTIAENLGVSFSNGVILIAFLLGLIWYAKGLKIGTLINMITFAGIFVWFYESSDSLNWLLPLVLVIVNIIILAISLYGETKVSPSGIA